MSDILLVEDDFETQEATSEVLRAHGYGVQIAGDGRATLDYLERHPAPALILLDLMMPNMNGWEFRQAQRADPRFAAIPVVLVSAGAELEDQARLFDVEIVIRKPVELHTLLQAVARYVAKPQSSALK